MNPLPALALATALVAAPLSAQPTTSPDRAMPASGPAASSPGEYVKMAGASDLYERQSSQLVLQTTQDAKVRDFANMMIQQHTKSTNDVKTAAMQAGVAVPPPKLDPDQARMMSELRAARGADRDAAYLRQQMSAHQMALALHQSYAANGTAAPLKAAAASIVPVVQSHIDMLRSMPASAASPM